MGKIGLPSISITFKELASSLMARSKRGIVALVLRDESVEGKFTLFSVADIPVDLSEENKEQISMAFRGYQLPPRKVELVVEKGTLEEPFNIASETFKYLESKRFDYLAVPFIDVNFSNELATWIKSLGDIQEKSGKVILPNTPADHERVINYTTPEVGTSEKSYKTNEFLARIAGFIAGTPPQIAPTYGPFPELLTCTNYTREEIEEKIGNGEFVLLDDGEKIKCARGVNSLTTVSEVKGESFRKIKIVEIMDIIRDDVKKEIEDNYLGKYSGSYDNKLLIIGSVQGYFEQLENEGLLERGTSKVELDLDAISAYLKSIGYKTPDGRVVEEMEISELKEVNTKDKLFITARIVPLDAIEEIMLPIGLAG